MHKVNHEVQLLALTSKNDQGLKEYLKSLGAEDWESDAPSDVEEIIEIGSRSCYKSFGIKLNSNISRTREGNRIHLGNIIDVDHGSVMEHSWLTFSFRNVSRVFTHELVRHRVGTAMCVTGDTLIYSENYANGNRNRVPKRTIKYLYELTKTPYGRSRIPLFRLRTLDEDRGIFRSQRHGIKNIVYSGVKPVFEVEIEGGYKLKLTKEHRLFTDQGWKSLEEVVQFLYVSPRTQMAFYGDPVARIAVNGYQASPRALLQDGVPIYRNKKWLKGMLESGLSYEEIAEKAGGISPHTIHTWIYKLGLGGIRKSNSSWWHKSGNKGKHYKLNLSDERRKELSIRMSKMRAKQVVDRGGSKYNKEDRVLPPKLRMSILERDGFICNLCFDFRRHLQVHHIDPWEPNKSTNLDEKNLITLCRKCHRKVTGKEDQYADYFFSMTCADRRAIRLPEFRKIKGLRPKFNNVLSIRYVGEEDTYDIIMDDPDHNYVANGVVVHNSQESLRFVRLDDMGLWIPECFRDISEAVEEFEQHWIDSGTRYTRLLELASEKEGKGRSIDGFNSLPFTIKKRYTSAARRVAPIGVSTDIIWSTNIRNLRHVIDKRTAPGAEEEIMVVFQMIAELVIKAFPNLFQDFRIKEGHYMPKNTWILERAKDLINKDPEIAKLFE